MPIPFLPGVKVIAVVGASRNPEKWGYKVFVTLKEKYPDTKVYPINPNATEIAGEKAYPSLKDLPEKPDLVVTVVPPTLTEKIVKEAKELGVKAIWMQPGSESEKAIKEAEAAGIKVYHHTCIVQSSEAGKIIPFKFSRE
ncbi:MAG: CoA-binding protein [Candidatus Njordarchaeales archaeon]